MKVRIDNFTFNKTDKKIIISYTEEGITKSIEQNISVINNPENNKDNTKGDGGITDKEIPNAGVEKNIIFVIGVVVIVIMASYFGYKK